MSDITLLQITSGYNVSKINGNFVEIQDVINDDLLHLNGGNNTMLQDLDMNGNSLLNVSVDVSNPDSLLTVGDADARYVNQAGDSMTGDLNMSSNTVTGLGIPSAPSDAVRKLDLDNEIVARSSADANLQAQMTGNVPLEASAFSPISWHDQSVDNSVVIPDNKNAWSFGPTMTISMGQTVTVGTDSFWTIANGEVV
ncbi:hypothetical protein D3C78_615900 [compost metagenome]